MSEYPFAANSDSPEIGEMSETGPNPPRVVPPRLVESELVSGQENLKETDLPRASVSSAPSSGGQESSVALEPPRVRRPNGLEAEPYKPAAVVTLEETLARLLKRVGYFPFWTLARIWDLACLGLLLAVVAGIPVVQFASLGYLLTAAANLAKGYKWSRSFPGQRLAGKLGTYALLSFLLWLPVWLVTDFSYSAQLLLPGSASSVGWRIGAFLITFAWILHIGWAAMRGGRWWHILWPQPIRFVTQIWRHRTWSIASDRLYELVEHLRFPQLWFMGLMASIGALVWLTLPVSLMIIGQRADIAPAALIGLIGAAMMSFVMLYLPFLQIEYAKTNRFSAFVALPTIRSRFRYRPWAHSLSLLTLCLLSLPLYLLRIEATPSQLVWASSLVFGRIHAASKAPSWSSDGLGRSTS